MKNFFNIFCEYRSVENQLFYHLERANSDRNKLRVYALWQQKCSINGVINEYYNYFICYLREHDISQCYNTY